MFDFVIISLKKQSIWPNITQLQVTKIEPIKLLSQRLAIIFENLLLLAVQLGFLASPGCAPCASSLKIEPEKSPNSATSFQNAFIIIIS